MTKPTNPDITETLASQEDNEHSCTCNQAEAIPDDASPEQAAEIVRMGQFINTRLNDLMRFDGDTTSAIHAIMDNTMSITPTAYVLIALGTHIVNQDKRIAALEQKLNH